MKKILALALAAVMTAGMTTVAFAKNDTNVIFYNTDSDRYAIDANEDDLFLEFAGDSRNEFGLTEVEGGKKVALFLYDDFGNPITKAEDVDGLKIVTDWEKGNVKPEKPKVERVEYQYQTNRSSKVYAVTFVLPESPETTEADLNGTITIYKSTSEKKSPYNNFDINLTYGYEIEEDFDGTFADPSKGGVVKFEKDAGEIDIEFDDDAMFTVDVTGQSKLNLRYNCDFDSETAAMYDYANIDFITFEAEPTFNKTGTMYIYADEDAFVYEVVEDGVKKIDGLKWNEDYEAWEFKTRKLTSYAISDVELDEKTVTEDNSSSATEDGNKQNPDTGR